MAKKKYPKKPKAPKASASAATHAKYHVRHADWVKECKAIDAENAKQLAAAKKTAALRNK